MLHCWRYGGTTGASSNVTRLFMRWLAHRGIKPASFIDYHGGLGLTAAQLAMGQPDARVMFHTAVVHHGDIARAVFKKLGLKNVCVVDEIEPAEVLVAQETMEHFSDPCLEIRRIIDIVKPERYLDGSSFTIDACGHFRHNKKVSKPFNATLRELGYETYWNVEGINSPFNAKPAVWVKGRSQRAINRRTLLTSQNEQLKFVRSQKTIEQPVRTFDVNSMKVYTRNAKRGIIHVRKGAVAYGPGVTGTMFDIQDYDARVQVTIDLNGKAIVTSRGKTELWPRIGVYDHNNIVLDEI